MTVELPVPASDLVEAHHQARLLSSSAVHLARTLARLAGGLTPEAELAVAYAAQAPVQGDAAVDLFSVRDDLRSDEFDGPRVDDVPWPLPTEWLQSVLICPLVTGDAPTVVVRGSLVYLHKYDDFERRVADEVLERSRRVPNRSGDVLLVAGELLTGDGSREQLVAVRQALSRALSIMIGGPGTGKTTTVAALLAEVVAVSGMENERPRVVLAAPTGKAAARLGEALRHAAARLPDEARAIVVAAPCSTLHRLIGWSTRGLPRYHRQNPLPYDLIVVDETSMVSLPLMARVLDAVHADARLVLVGDHGQLASVEAGTVLSDLVAGGHDGPLAGCITELVVSRRFPPGSPLDRLARAVRLGDPKNVVKALNEASEFEHERGGITWIGRTGIDAEVRRQLGQIIDPELAELTERAVQGDGPGALAVLGRVHLLCAHRRGPYGIESWNHWVRDRAPRQSDVDPVWYPGRPVMITSNDPSTGLYNGDVGVVIHTGGRTMVAFDSASDLTGVRLVSPARLDHVETVHAMTIHKSQGSEFGHVMLVLPPPDSRLAARDLLYTAITRATHHLTVVGDQQSVEQAVMRRTSRIGGLADRLSNGRTGIEQAPAGPGEVP